MAKNTIQFQKGLGLHEFLEKYATEELCRQALYALRWPSGRIEMDDAYLGGEKAGKRGRVSPNKIPFVATVETTQDGRPLKIQLRRVQGFRQREIARYAQASLMAGSHLFSDGLTCFVGVTEASCEHSPIVTGGGRQSAQHSCFKWANTMLGNVKNSLLGTYHAIQEKHVPRYLAVFESRFNRRFDLPVMFERLLFVSLRTPPMPYRLMRMA